MTTPAQPSHLPPAMRRQVDEANRMIAELNARPGQVPAGAAPQQDPGQTPQPAAAQPAAATPPPLAAAPDPAAAAAPSPEEQARLANARYAALQGKYNAEMQRMRDLNEQQSRLVQQLLEQRPAAAAAPAPAAQQSPEDFLRSLGATDEDIKDYGEVLPIVARIAQNMFKPTLEKIERELAQVRASAGVVTKELVADKRAKVFAALDRAVPNWRVINDSEEFLGWLQAFDVFSGVTRRVALASSFEALDATRVAGIFEAYVKEYPESARASAGGPSLNAETLLAPTTRGGADTAPDGAGGKRIYTESEIKDFYTRVRRKQVTPEEYQRFSADIAAAVTEGRVRPDRMDHHQNGR